MLEIEESTSRSQYTRAKALLEEILLKRKIIKAKGKRMAKVISKYVIMKWQNHSRNTNLPTN